MKARRRLLKDVMIATSLGFLKRMLGGWKLYRLDRSCVPLAACVCE